MTLSKPSKDFPKFPRFRPYGQPAQPNILFGEENVRFAPFSSPPKMFFTQEARQLACEKNILGGEEKVSEANLFFSEENVRRGPAPFGTSSRSIGTFLLGVCGCHQIWLVPTLFGQFYMPKKMGQVRIRLKRYFRTVRWPKVAHLRVFGHILRFFVNKKRTIRVTDLNVRSFLKQFSFLSQWYHNFWSQGHLKVI